MRIPLTQPIDGNNKPMNLVPAVVALAVTYDASLSSATDITLNAATSLIEVSATGKGIFLRWAASASSTNFDEFINAETTRVFAVPTGITIASIIEEAASAHGIVIEK